MSQSEPTRVSPVSREPVSVSEQVGAPSPSPRLRGEGPGERGSHDCGLLCFGESCERERTGEGSARLPRFGGVL